MATTNRQRYHAFLLVSASAVVAAAILTRPTDADSPRVTWRVGDNTTLAPFAEIDPGKPVRVAVELPEALHLYVTRFDLDQGCIALWPSETLVTDARPGPTTRLTLPGEHDGISLAWPTGENPGPVAFVLIASRKPLPDLAAALARCRQMGNAAFPKRSLLDPYAPKAGMEAAPPRSELPHPLLREAFALTDVHNSGPMTPAKSADGVWLKALRLIRRGDPPTPDSRSVEERLQERIGELLEGTPAQILPKPR